LFPSYQPAHYELNGKELSLVYGAGRVSNMMFRDLRTWLPMESNRKLDRISMWNSIEARSPFQSEKVISHGLTSMRMANFRSLRKQTLYSAYPELKNLPINQNKLGFISPVGHWLRNNPELVRLTLRNLPNYIEVNKAELANLSDAPTERNFQNIKILWSLVVLNKWFMNQ
jgi:asparagine synthetase B (glutamine-hydrolysing)